MAWSSKPSTDRSCGARSPTRDMASSRLIASSSVSTSTAVGISSTASSWPSNPSPSRTSAAVTISWSATGTPATACSLRKPSIRSTAL